MEGDRGTTASSRRRFLGTAAGATGVALGAAVWGAGTAAAAVAPSGGAQRLSADIKQRAFAAGKFGVELDGIMAGWVESAEGGHAVSDVVSEKLGPDHIVHKHLAGVKYEDITINMGLSMSKAIYDWIAASWKMSFQRKNGAIVVADFNYNVVSERQFFNALITETTIPACDASSKDPAFMTLKFAPEYTRVTKPSGRGSTLQKPAQSAVAQKMWLPSNFRLQIDGLDCTKVNKIDAFTVKQTMTTDQIGDARDYNREPATVEVPNLRIQLPVSGGQTWNDWFEDFVIKGNNIQEKEKGGTLAFLSPNRQTELAKITFFNLGIFKLTDDPQPDATDSIPRLTAELYCERMELLVNATVPPSPTQPPIVIGPGG